VERIAVGGGTGALNIDTEEADDDDEEWHGIGTEKSKISGNPAGSSDEDYHDPPLEGRWWVGSVGHEDGLRLSNLMAFFRDGENADTDALGVEYSNVAPDGSSEAGGEGEDELTENEVDAQTNDDNDQPIQMSVKRNRNQEKNPQGKMNKKERKKAVVVGDASFFGDL
jgi:hypothetical protein